MDKLELFQWFLIERPLGKSISIKFTLWKASFPPSSSILHTHSTESPALVLNSQLLDTYWLEYTSRGPLSSFSLLVQLPWPSQQDQKTCLLAYPSGFSWPTWKYEHFLYKTDLLFIAQDFDQGIGFKSHHLRNSLYIMIELFSYYLVSSAYLFLG